MEYRHLSQEKVLKTLRDIGLTRLDSKIYIYLAKKGPQKGNEIFKALKVQKQQIYSSLKNLQKKAIVSATLEHPARFSAVPFEKVLDLFIRTKFEEAQCIQTEKNKLLSSWQTIQTDETPDVSARFMVIEGRNIIYSRIKQMVNEAKNQLSLISTVTGLARADRFGILGSDFKHLKFSDVQFRLLTYVTDENTNIIQALLNETPKTELRFEIRNPNLGLGLFPQMVIRDEEEVMFFINPKVDGALNEQDNLCLWTNCKSMIHSFLALFEELWRNSTHIDKKIMEVKIGKSSPKTYGFSNTEQIKKKYNELIQHAQKEIILITSSNGLNQHRKNIAQFSNLAKRGIKVKIMAPIVKENWEAMKKFSKFCAIKHVPNHYFGTTVIDGKHVFQFKTAQVKRQTTSCFNNVFYTCNIEWSKTMKTALNEIWDEARTPSTSTLESTVAPGGHPVFPLPKNDLRTKIESKVIDFKPPGILTEEEVLNKIIYGKKFTVKDPSKEVQRSYGSYAFIAIHLPNQFNLPDMLIHIQKHDQKSSFGEGADMTVYLNLDVSENSAYIPVATINDNPKVPSQLILTNFLDAPNARNYRLVRKEELQVLVHGNTMFAGWTVPIQLFPLQYVLPPACILIEGYGSIRTTEFTLYSSSGFRTTFEDNAFDAFVTFLHNKEKYSGPGTDGVLVRDSISTTFPP